jgi:hypothetical protein
LGAGVACSPGVREHLAILAPVTCAQVDNVIARLRSKKTWRWLIVPGKKLAASGKNEELKIPAPQIIHRLSSTAAVRETPETCVGVTEKRGTPAAARRWFGGLTAKGEEGTYEKIFSHVGCSGVVGFERNRFGTEPDAAEQRQPRCRNVWTEDNTSG